MAVDSPASSRRGWWPRLISFATRGIPELPAETLGFFRVFYATFLFIALSGRRLVIDDDFVGGARSFDWAWAGWLVSRPDIVARLEDGILVLLVLFAVGLFTRVSYALIAAGLSVWIVVMLQQDTNIHVWEVAFLMVLCVVPVPWGEAFSVDETIRRWRGRGRPADVRGKRLGFAVWIPGFILGAVWFGAAVYKLQDSGLEWILGGAVKYHWVIDARDAPVDWGLWVATHHWAAVVMSFFGVALESTFILASFARTSLARTALASAIGMPLLIGFFLFHGVLWWTWWLVLLSFTIPWQTFFDAVSSLVPSRVCQIDTSTLEGRRRARFRHGLDWFNRLTFVDTATPGAVAAAPPTQGLRPIQGLLILVVCALMVRELPEGIGRFTSYSNTYVSTDAFDRRNPTKPVNRLWVGYGTSNGAEVFLDATDAALIMKAIDRLSRDEPFSAMTRAKLQSLHQRLAEQYRDRRVTLTRDRNKFDWQTGRYVRLQREVIATLDMNSMTLDVPPQSLPSTSR